MEEITRKRMLYKSKVEYMNGQGVYTMNYIFGCSHGCKFSCYAYAAARRRKQVESYEEWCEPKIVANTLELLAKELEAKRREPIERVHMCFTTDPFMYEYPEIADLTLDCIELINSHGIPVTVLTKGEYPTWVTSESFIKERLLQHSENEYGVSIPSLHEGFRMEFEPFTPKYGRRLGSIGRLKMLGARTWVSMEPFPAMSLKGMDERYGSTLHGGLPLKHPRNDDLDNLRLVTLNCAKFADKIVFGRWNYNSEMPTDADDVPDWYTRTAEEFIRLCSVKGVECVVKRGTAEPKHPLAAGFSSCNGLASATDDTDPRIKALNRENPFSPAC